MAAAKMIAHAVTGYTRRIASGAAISATPASSHTDGYQPGCGRPPRGRTVTRRTAKEFAWAREIVSLIARTVAAAAITASKASDHAVTCGRSPSADSLAMG